ncbi:MAG TPA: SDR family NAD(P)-dependent oxidoreductase [Kribbella sp.]|uniref:SDR family NAD(P)-dependent oxidoreductase n=1 Tax=Kribbella sp. TaxID=1871183 RepID=UPI002D78F377|nr:SDR family NAD(P)-dependent oxidoreductase [Kribbella sp.]HET6292330.1 SDR family NAD(P)-dependent oxidoreductase [Kribbella sp.]
MDSRPVIVITGATNGLGKLVALDLAERGIRLGVVARSQDKVDELRAEIGRLAPAASVDAFLADLSSLAEVRRAAAEIDAHYERIDVLINNAGLHAFSQRVTVDGFSEMVAVNYLAPWVLTNALREKLIASAPARVVTVASEAARQAGDIVPARDLVSTEDYTRRESSKLYGRTKLMDIMFSQELGRQLAATGVTANCCDPGFNTSGLGRELPGSGVLEKILKTLRIGDPRRGAAIISRLAADPAFATTTAGYFSVKNAALLECPLPGRPERIQQDLWTTTTKLVETRVPPSS